MSRPPAGRHDAFLYTRDAAYLDHVVGFVAAGVRAGERVLVITPGDRWAEITPRLDGAGVDHEHATRSRTLIWTDADTVLEHALVNGVVALPRFQALVQRLLAGKPVHRIYGDAGAMLVHRDDLPGALELEHGCNDMVHVGAVRISCGYRLQHFSGDASDWGVRSVMNAHADTTVEPGAWDGRRPSDGPDRMTRRGERILLWDDYADTCNMYAEALTFCGYQVITAADAPQALALAAAYRPDVVVVDVRLPAKIGVATMHTLRTRHAFSAPILALTAHAFPAERREIFADGFDTVLSKPCLPEALVAAVTKALDGRSRPGDGASEARATKGS